jgi:Universal stress protein family
LSAFKTHPSSFNPSCDLSYISLRGKKTEKRREELKDRDKKKMSDHRTIGIGMDYSPSSKTALKWAVENIARAGDHVVLIHTQPHTGHSAQKQLWEEEGSRRCSYVFLLV